ncbi:transcription elongation factor spt4 [Gnomoniopsis sp. IMI 355080]|uniref:Transcription elongation factor SPT4 n=1 Tax=Gnomoniopsis smithogilvyi TaxID=1191159 RepID=A0A9W8YQ38_9PEZI|nr:transcription elongation factor spt4 [Gnomoniopsis smithogilvyi]KAJ4425307.1 transcription elongation factor spt4 [Gnomoniopsis sp. IMI 355080]
MDKYSSETQRRGKRACMVCSIVLPKTEFKRNGCPNCEDYLHLSGNEEAIELCTSNVYEGLIAMGDPSKSWVAKWQRIDKYRPGTYATKVMGVLPEDVVTSLADEYNIRYIPRDGSAGNDD